MTPKLTEESAALACAPASRQPRRLTAAADASPAGSHVGTLIGFDGSGAPLVDFPSNPFLKAVPARTCVDLGRADVGSEVVLSFETGDFARPLVMGCLRSLAVAEEIDIDLASLLSTASLGEEVNLTAVRSLTLRCGKASITLTRDGLVQVNGTYVETRATGTNRIQGGSVRIN